MIKIMCTQQGISISRLDSLVEANKLTGNDVYG